VWMEDGPLGRRADVRLCRRPLRAGLNFSRRREGARDCDRDRRKKHPEPGEDAPVRMAFGGIAVAAFEMQRPRWPSAFMWPHRLDGGAASQLALDDTKDAALLSRDEDATRMWRVMAAISLVDIGALDLAAGELLGVLGDVRRVYRHTDY
jgi:hypothetical protein